MVKDLPLGGVDPATQGVLVEALKGFKVKELVDVVTHGNEFQRRAAMACLEGFKDRLNQEHLPFLVGVQRLGITEADCSGRCRALVCSTLYRLNHQVVVVGTVAEAVA